MYLSRRKRLRQSRVLFFVSSILLCCMYQLALRARLMEPWAEPQIAENPEEQLTPSTKATVTEVAVSNHTAVNTPTTGDTTTEATTKTTTEAAREPTTKTTTEMSTEMTTVTESEKTTQLPTSTTTNQTHLRHCIYVEPEPPKTTLAPKLTPFPSTTPPMPNTTLSSPGNAPHMKGDYPADLFSVEQRRQGWVILHIFGMVYMFVSLAIVCDEFFVPALGVITAKLAISDDVAGATFMAAGGSAPELFTSLIGVFISHSNVGIGTIVGSAVFNILFVIGMCAIFSREMLHLTWWPLFRDVSFYILDLILLIIFFLDNTIMWWESTLLVMSYCSYVLFMKYNVQLEQTFKELLSKHKKILKVFTVEEPEKDDGSPPAGDSKTENGGFAKNLALLKLPLQRGGSSASLHNCTMRTTILQLMIHSLDPLREVKLKDKAEIMKEIVQKKEAGKEEKKEDEPSKPETPVKEAEQQPQEGGQKGQEGAGSGDPGGSGGSEGSDSSEEDSEDDSDDDSDEDDDEAESEEPLSLQWPDTRRSQASYLFLLPIVLPLWLTVPDVRNAASRKYFAGTFLGSIMWIGVFSYLMVWWAHQVGETIGISEEIMGLTILAAGTSIPDLITSVIVARKGLGDMAVSSSVGSNIFDITVGLPVPWLLYSSFHSMRPVAVSSNGLFCAIVLLFLMLLFVILSIAFCKWKMNKLLGSTMFLLYFIFLVLSVLLEDRIIVCPVTI